MLISICPAIAGKKKLSFALPHFISRTSPYPQCLPHVKRDTTSFYIIATMRGSLRLQNGLRASRPCARNTNTLATHFSFSTRSSAPASFASHTATNPQHSRNHIPDPFRKSFHTSSSLSKRSDGPPESPPPTSFNELDVLGSVPVPSTSVDVCTYDGFGLNSGITIEGGDGALLVSGEAFAWRPWEVIGEKKLVNEKGQFELPREAFGLFDMLWPRPGMFHLFGV